MKELQELEFSKSDITHIQKMGAKLPFSSGKEVYNYIKNNKIRVVFSPFENSNIHAQWDLSQRTIRINSIYKNTKDPAVILAIAESIMHEAGHAKDNDNRSSIQEELDCLAINALSHRVFEKNYPNIFINNTNKIIKNGVNLYSDLMFKEQTTQPLIDRLKNSYKDLPAGDFNHPPSNLAIEVKKQ